jgi:hypothetical protein
MSELGMTVAWLAVQVVLLGLPGLALHALATRRGPASGAWVAALCLGLVVVLSVSALFTGNRPVGSVLAEAGARSVPARAYAHTPDGSPDGIGHGNAPDRTRPIVRHGWGLADLRLAWSRLERGAAEPAARCRPWGTLLAVVALAGTSFGLLRLITGLWAVRICRRHSRVVDDPGMTGLLDELRVAMRCLPHMEIREAAELTTPATAGWWQPVLLVPNDWRSWSDSERRAVLAHELGHIVRGDYAVGLLARLAVALNYFHPVVRWMAGRLQLQQEQAADALGARFAGGRASYLVALSRLALKQDGQTLCWPAREFLPVRRTLLRRIAMLRRQNGTGTMDRPLSRGWRLVTTFTLLGLTLGVATLRGPARGGEGEEPATATSKVRATTTHATGTPILPPYVPEGAAGLIAFRPAAIFRRMDSGITLPLIAIFAGVDFADLPKGFKVISPDSGSLEIGVEDIEWVTCALSFGRVKTDAGDNRTFVLGVSTVRTVVPFDWLAFLRQWRFGFVEARHGGRVYYKLTGPMKELLGPNPCLCLLDDRTVVFDEEESIRAFLGRKTPQTPAYILGPDWERASRGLLAVAINNENGEFKKQYDLGRPEDAVALSLFKDVNQWTLWVDDADSIALHAAATCRNGEANKTISGVIDSLLKSARALMEQPDPEALAAASREQSRDYRVYRMLKALLANLRVERTERAVELFSHGFGTLADVGLLIKAEADEEMSRIRAAGAGRNAPSGNMDRRDR